MIDPRLFWVMVVFFAAIVAGLTLLVPWLWHVSKPFLHMVTA